MVFDIQKWDMASLDQITSTISGIYSMLLVCIYIAFAFTELVKYPNLDEYLERNGFFLYLFLGCDIYFIYIFLSIYKTNKYVQCWSFKILHLSSSLQCQFQEIKGYRLDRMSIRKTSWCYFNWWKCQKPWEPHCQIWSHSIWPWDLCSFHHRTFGLFRA